MNITLPRIYRSLFNLPGNKNSILQFVADKIVIPLNIVDANKDFVTIENAGILYYLSNNSSKIPPSAEYALLTNILPTKSKLEGSRVKIKSWIKHPNIKKVSPSEVNESWNNQFYYREEIPDKSPGLRQPQIAALHMIMGHLKLPLDAATVVMPTGTGKTETMLSALVANQCERLLVTVPSDSLREQIANKFLSLGLLKQFNIVGEDALYPIVGIIKNKFNTIQTLEEFFKSCNVIVTTMPWLIGQTLDIQDKIAEVCSHVFIDEAHHVKANSWNEFRNRFEKEKVIQFTATPFRNDGKRLDGKIISNFPLRKAQEQGYYKKIEFIPVREFDIEKADQQIAEIAVKKLRADRALGFNHILMARCATKQRARSIFKLYEGYKEFNPVVIYSGLPQKKEIYQKILRKEARIIVCVDMLGEGFDLPELKIAAFHDIRKSLPITLQLAGRFTRTKYDENLGDASFIANIADLDVRAELADLYATDADWNEILSDTSFDKIDEQVQFKDFMEGFAKLSRSSIPFQNIVPKLSAVVYKNKTSEWNPSNFKAGIKGYDDFDFKFHDINSNEKILVIITGQKTEVEWVHHKEIYDIQWDIIIVFWDTKSNLLFINSSDNSSVYWELAQAIIGGDAEIIKGINVFKTFYNLKRVRLQNVGLRQFLGKNIRFRMMVGSDVGEALSLAEKQRGEKAFVMGTGYENGSPVNIGASYKGRIWTKLKGDLKDYKKWCLTQGGKLNNDTIDPNQILKETLIPTLVSELPKVFPVWIDWDLDMYMDLETKFRFSIGGFTFDMSTVDLHLTSPILGGPLKFSLVTERVSAHFQMNLFDKVDGDEKYPVFEVIQLSTEPVEIIHGTKIFSGIEFFEHFIPTIWFADGSALTGNEYVELKQSIGLFDSNEIIVWDWSGVNLQNESQHVFPKIEDSIQYKVIQDLKAKDYDIIYDDDYSGEIADVITIKLESEKIHVEMYHLKYAHNGNVSNQVKNFYEVCGQAQKSIHWKHKSGKEFINHLLRRETKSRNENRCSRLEKGSRADLEKLLHIIKNEIPVEYKIFIVQPGLSKAVVSNEILTLLGVTETYIKEFADINVKVIGSA